MDELLPLDELASQNINEHFELTDEVLARQVTAGDNHGTQVIPRPKRLGSKPRQATLLDRWDQSLLKGVVPHNEAASSVEVGVADLFSGAGGFSLGIHNAIKSLGFAPRFALSADEDEEAQEVYDVNFAPTYQLTGNLGVAVDYGLNGWAASAEFDYFPEVIDPTLSKLEGQVSLLIAGPPCQGHSNVNNRTRRNDPRNLLYLTVPAIAVSLNIPMVVIENVPGVRRAKESVVETSCALLEQAGYLVDTMILSASNLGVPQTRQRHLIVASKLGQPSIRAAYEAFKRRSRSVKWAIHDLSNAKPKNAFDRPAEISDENRARIEYLFDNDLHELPDQQRPECHQDGHTYPAVYGRLKWDDASGTITTGFMSPGRGRFTHPGQPRSLTPHEGARLQGFPDSFRFELSSGEELRNRSFTKLIGDAVPPAIGFVGGIAALATMGPPTA